MSTLVPYGSELPANPDPYLPRRYNDTSPLRTLFGVIMGRFRLALLVAVLTLVTVVGIATQLPRTYYAEASLLVQPRRPNLAQATAQDQQNMLPDTSAIDTEVELLRSPAIADAVVRKMKLYLDPEFNAYLPDSKRPPKSVFQNAVEWVQERLGWERIVVDPDPNNQPLIAAVVDSLQRHSFVRRVGLTYVVRIGTVSSTPEKSEAIADAYVDAYLNRQVGEKLTAFNQANKELNANMGNLRQEALTAEAELQKYKNDNNLMSVEGATMAEAEVSQLNRQIAEARADYAEKQARLDTALDQVKRGSGGSDNMVALQSDTIRVLREREAAASQKLAELSSRFKSGYPEVQRTQAELNDIHRQIQGELNRILSGVRSEAQAAAQRVASLEQSRTRSEAGLASNNKARVGLVALEQRADAAKKIYESYMNRASEVAVERSLQQADATVNYRAAGSATVASPNMRLAFALGTVLALFAAAAAIIVSEFWNRRVRSRRDIENEIGVPMAGILPDLRSVVRIRRRAGPPDHLVQYPFTAFAEAFRNLRAYLMLSDQTGPSKIIAVASAVPREGKTMTSICLARTLAQSGSSVVLVDCDLRQRGVTKFIGSAKQGLVEVVENDIPLEQALMRDPKTSAWILPATGRRVPYDLFSKGKTDEVMRELAEKFDYVILDTPPILGVADARILVAKADRVLYLVQWNKTPMSTARAAVDVLQESGANIAGTILTQVNTRQQARYGYGDGSDYFHYYRRQYLTEG